MSAITGIAVLSKAVAAGVPDASIAGPSRNFVFSALSAGHSCDTTPTNRQWSPVPRDRDEPIAPAYGYTETTAAFAGKRRHASRDAPWPDPG
ncbi:hypothetical protein IEQ11_24735 [Lysobacter capsici]|uniref:hypothetical protein n=1 Tax=Lysobacter capsici TaxID=435897 RepID=UPI0017844420|nr:hypothetical protein [Lysobacter capsici]UOF14878.1 hypothetical protein IEQ11_24735 [Lysobacter capsici]